MEHVSNLRLCVEYWPLSRPKPNPRNSKLHPRAQLKQIARSIREFGNLVPIIVDSDDTVIAGHGRLQAAQSIGLSEVPVLRVEHLTAVQKAAFAIADNKLTENGAWDPRQLAETLQIIAADISLEVEITGFAMGEIDLVIESQKLNPANKSDPADQMPIGRDGQPVSLVGDLWCLGEHRVLCGSALEPHCYAEVMAGDTAVMLISDPPYNVPIAGHASGLGRVRHGDFAMAVGELTPEAFVSFLQTFLTCAVAHCRPGAIFDVFMDWRHLDELSAATKAVGLERLNLAVWVKNNAGMGSLYRSQHELVFVFKYGDAPHRNNVQLGKYGRHRSNVWTYPNAATFSRNTEEGNLLAVHPTVKPVRLVADALLDCSARGDVVLDPFLGSGTTVMAAERIGRRCCGLELDPYFVDTIVRRWQQYTGGRASLAGSAKLFDQIADEGR